MSEPHLRCHSPLSFVIIRHNKVENKLKRPNCGFSCTILTHRGNHITLKRVHTLLLRGSNSLWCIQHITHSSMVALHKVQDRKSAIMATCLFSEAVYITFTYVSWIDNIHWKQSKDYVQIFTPKTSVTKSFKQPPSLYKTDLFWLRSLYEMQSSCKYAFTHICVTKRTHLSLKLEM